MPNWCYTDYIFHANDNLEEEEARKEVERFLAKVNEVCESCPIENGFGKDWLGGILYAAYLKDGETQESARNKTIDGDIRCRGSIIFQTLMI